MKTFGSMGLTSSDAVASTEAVTGVELGSLTVRPIIGREWSAVGVAALWDIGMTRGTTGDVDVGDPTVSEVGVCGGERSAASGRTRGGSEVIHRGASEYTPMR